MTLPRVPLPTGTATIADGEVPIRAMARLEVRKLREYSGRAADAEPFILSCGTGVSLDDATDWLGSVDSDVGGQLVDAILVLSGLAKPSCKHPDAERVVGARCPDCGMVAYLDWEDGPGDPRVGSTGAGPTARPSNEP